MEDDEIYIGWIAKDPDGDVWLFENKPERHPFEGGKRWEWMDRQGGLGPALARINKHNNPDFEGLLEDLKPHSEPVKIQYMFNPKILKVL